ncbi:MAG: hypothetical protein HPY59_02975 [Anaerolineae bacterium]|nr:hypothetical protein [Anaerolineae bacterium]
MTYPLSSDVSSGQPTAYQHYNNLRSDALYLGQPAADSVSLGAFLQRYADNIKLEYLDTDRLRVPFVTTRPPTIMIQGAMCQATANVDLPSNSFSGVAATWYVFAKRTPGSSTFTLEVNTSSAETSTTRLIGEVYWDGSHLNPGTIKTYTGGALPSADYDSGWFAVANNQTYTKAHSLGQPPRLVVLLHSSVASPGAANELVQVNVAFDDVSGVNSIIGWEGTNILITTGSNATMGTLLSKRRISAAGYYRIFAWR